MCGDAITCQKEKEKKKGGGGHRVLGRRGEGGGVRRRSLKLTKIRGKIVSSEYKFRSTIKTRQNVGNIGFSRNKDLGRSKVTKLEDSSSRIKKKVLRFDIAMADSDRVNICQRT